MLWLFYTTVFVLGLIVGSFINCIVYRLRLKKSFMRGRSFCPHCKQQIKWHDNIPVISYFLLKARCRYCKKLISIHYPLVELITGILFIIIFIATLGPLNNISQFLSFSVSQFLLLLRNWIFTAILIIIFIYDLRHYLILDKVAIPAMLIALPLNIIIYTLKHGSFNLFSCFLVFLLAGILAGGFFLIQFVISKGKWIGGGDIRLGFLMGLMLGWPNILVALALAYILGSLVGILLILLGKKTIKSQIPLGTFLTFGTLVALLWGRQLIDWYLGVTF